MKNIARAILATIVAAIILAATIIGCTPAERVVAMEEVTGKTFVPAHTEVYTTTEYKYNILAGDFALVPITHSRWVEDRYTIQVRIVWEDGGQKEETRSVTAEEWAEIQVGDNLAVQDDGDH